MFTISQYGKKWLGAAASKRWVAVLASSFLFFAEVLGPFELACVSFEFQRAFFAFARAEPQDGSVVFDVHHACAGWEVVAAE